MPNAEVVRECGDCTKCCEGHLVANIKGFEMQPGKPCPILQIGKGCGDYDNRPEKPCKTFKCQWLKTPLLPDWLKPSESGVIVTVQKLGDMEYLKMTSAPNPPDADALTWFMSFLIKNQINGAWDGHRKKYWTGSQEFVQLMTDEYGVQ